MSLSSLLTSKKQAAKMESASWQEIRGQPPASPGKRLGPVLQESTKNRFQKPCGLERGFSHCQTSGTDKLINGTEYRTLQADSLIYGNLMTEMIPQSHEEGLDLTINSAGRVIRMDKKRP